MFKGLQNGWDILGESVRFFFTNPKVIFPLLICWGVYVPVTLYLYFEVDFTIYSFGEQIGLVFLFIFAFSFIISVSSLILLELLEQKETKGKMSIFVAVKDAFTRDLIRTLPIIVVWSIVVFVVTIIEALINAAKKKRGREDRKEFSAKAAAEVLAGNGEFSFSGAFFKMLKKGIRMAVLLMLPAIAWEEKKSVEAAKKGLHIFRVRISEMISGILLSQLVTLIVFLPVIIMFILSGKYDMTFSDNVWYAVILYMGFAWSYSMLVEQLFTAELYLWHIKWEKACETAKKNDEEIPKFNNIERPSFLDQVPDLIEFKS